MPGDVAVLGYDGLELAGYGAVPLSTVAQPAYAMGVAATQLLIASMEGHDAPADPHLVLQPAVIARHSTVGRSDPANAVRSRATRPPARTRRASAARRPA